MNDQDPFGPKALKRVQNYIASGDDPEGHYVRAETLRKVIQATEDASQETKDALVAYLEAHLIQGPELVDAFRLGIACGVFSSLKDIMPDIFSIFRDIKNLDKLPFVSVRGKSVH